MKILIGIAFLLVSASAHAATNSKAEELAEAAWNYYYFGQSSKAETALKKAIDADPENQELKTAYAKSLFKNEKYNQTIAFLSQTKQPDQFSEEENFLVAVSHFNNYETDAARPYFEKVVANKGQLSASASLYLKELDNVKRYEAFAQFGALYDSSVIDDDFIAATDGSDGRVFMYGSMGYRLKKIGQTNAKLTGAIANYYSFDDNHSFADPMLLSLGGDFDRVKSLNDQDYNLRLRSTVDLLWLDADNDGSRSVFMYSPIVRLSAAEKGKQGVFNSYYGELRYNIGAEDSIDGTTNDVDGLGLKAGVKTTNPMSGNHVGVTDMYAKFNFASGDNIKFYRAGGSYSYLLPFKNWNVGLIGEGQVSHYPDAVGASTSRTDLELTAAAVGRRSVKDMLGDGAGAWLDNDWLFLELKTGYTLTASSEDVRDDSRFIVSSVAQGQWRF